MKPILVLQDADIFPGTARITDFSVGEQRVTVKVLLFDDHNNIALVATEYGLLPGGGVKAEETLEDALAREVLEEVGCRIRDVKEFGYGEEYRLRIQRHQIVHFFTAHIDGTQGAPQTTQEDERNIQISWHSLSEAAALLRRQVEEIPLESYHKCFNVRMHLAFLEAYAKDPNRKSSH